MNQSKIGKIGIFILLVLVAFTCAYPAFFLFMSTLKTSNEFFKDPLGLPEKFDLSNIHYTLFVNKLQRNALNTAICTISALLATLFLSSLAAYCFTKVRFRGRNTLFMIIISMMMIPAMVLLLPLYQIMAKLRLINNHLSLITVYTTMSLPYAIYLITSHFRFIPDELVQSAKIDGAGFYRIYWTIMLPMGRTAIITVGLILFVAYWNELILALMLLNRESVKTIIARIATEVAKFNYNPPLHFTGLFLSTAIRKVAELRRISGEFRTVLSLFSLGESMMPMI